MFCNGEFSTNDLPTLAMIDRSFALHFAFSLVSLRAISPLDIHARYTSEPVSRFHKRYDLPDEYSRPEILQNATEAS
jgi:hypothetical protein